MVFGPYERGTCTIAKEGIMALDRITFYFRHRYGGQFVRYREDEHLFAMRGVIIKLLRTAEEFGLDHIVEDLAQYLNEMSDKLRYDFGWDEKSFEQGVAEVLYHHYHRRVAGVWTPTAMAIGAIHHAKQTQQSSSVDDADATHN